MKKVLIIGAGPAGLTAAYELLDKSKDYEVTVDFDDHGVKKMFAGFAKLKKL